MLCRELHVFRCCLDLRVRYQTRRMFICAHNPPGTGWMDLKHRHMHILLLTTAEVRPLWWDTSRLSAAGVPSGLCLLSHSNACRLSGGACCFAAPCPPLLLNRSTRDQRFTHTPPHPPDVSCRWTSRAAALVRVCLTMRGHEVCLPVCGVWTPPTDRRTTPLCEGTRRPGWERRFRRFTPVTLRLPEEDAEVKGPEWEGLGNRRKTQESSVYICFC